jgi:hypothetical protein
LLALLPPEIDFQTNKRRSGAFINSSCKNGLIQGQPIEGSLIAVTPDN